MASFRATLEETRDADLLLHVIDASHVVWHEHREVVNGVLEELGVASKPVLHVFNKIDRLDQESLVALQERIAYLLPNSVFVSAEAEDGLEPLRRSLLAAVRELRPVAELRLSISDGRMMAEIHRSGEVIEQRSDGDEMVVRARLDPATLGRLRSQGVGVNSEQ